MLSQASAEETSAPSFSNRQWQRAMATRSAATVDDSLLPIRKDSLSMEVEVHLRHLCHYCRYHYYLSLTVMRIHLLPKTPNVKMIVIWRCFYWCCCCCEDDDSTGWETVVLLLLLLRQTSIEAAKEAVEAMAMTERTTMVDSNVAVTSSVNCFSKSLATS